MKKILSAIVASVLALGMCGPLAACNKNDDKSAYVSIDINPSVELVIGEDGLVAGVRGVNDDGLELVYGESGIIGESAEDAVEKIVSLAVSEGYLDENNSVVNTTVSAKNDKYLKKLTKNVNASITATADKSGLDVKIDAEGTYSLRRRLEEFKKAHPDNKVVQSLSLATFKLAFSLSETGEISLEAAVELENDELIDLIKEYDSKVEAYATEAYNLAKKQAQAAFDKAVTLYTYSEYTQFYARNILTHYETAYLGGVYQTYASAALMMDSVKKVAEYANRSVNYPLSEEQAKEIADVLGLESTEPLKDRNGNVTVKSIEAYADKLFKNSDLNAELSAKADALTAKLKATETAIQEKINALCVEYKDEIAAIVEAAEDAYSALMTVIAAVPEEYKQAFNAILNELNETLTALKDWANDEKTYFSDLDTFTARLKSQADKYLGKIKNDLTEEEWNSVQNNIARDIENAKIAQANYNKALEKAEAEAKAYIEALKNNKKNNA